MKTALSAIPLDHPELERAITDTITSPGTLHVVLKWTQSRALTLFTLQVQVTGGVFQEVLTAPLSDNDGDLNVFIGTFGLGSTIAVRFGILAVTPIPQAGLFMHNGLGVVKKLAPAGTTFKTLKQSETWVDIVPYTV